MAGHKKRKAEGVSWMLGYFFWKRRAAPYNEPLLAHGHTADEEREWMCKESGKLEKRIKRNGLS